MERFALVGNLVGREVSLVAVVLGLVRAFDRNAEVVGLLLGQLRQLDAELVQVQAGDFFVELLRQHVDAEFVLVVVPATVRSGPAPGW